jgi:hypothetical protein
MEYAGKCSIFCDIAVVLGDKINETAPTFAAYFFLKE